ncbi:MAG TPA: hypothetical protein VEQ10_03200 [Vicinamibacteria bacterium]|nr:hypothetical protein [Vicinamibacteria bacterium]
MSAPLRRLAWWAAGAAMALGLAALCVRLFLQYLSRPDLDQGLHVLFTRQLLDEGTLLPHFLYHLLVALVAGLSEDTGALTFAATLVLTALVLLKLVVSLLVLRQLAARAGAPLGPPAALALALAFFFVAPLPTWWEPENIYLGQLSPTVWHNPTAITALPLALASFWVLLGSGSLLRLSVNKPEAAGVSLGRALAAGGLLALSVTAKPNFALAFLPAVFVLWLLQRRLSPLRLLLLGLPALGVLAWQYLHAISSGLEARGAGLVLLRPLSVWRLYSPHPLVSGLVSLAFPLAVLAFARRDLRHRQPLAAAWLLTLVALAEFALLAEPEPRTGDANYYWGLVPATYLLFLLSAAELLAPRPLPGRRRLARLGCWLLLLLHAASGIVLYAVPFQLAVAD